jgi:hypothetical protein
MPPKKHPRKLSEAQFQQVFNEVRADINELQLHDKVFIGVVEQLGNYKRIGINFPGFFNAFLSAMRTDLVIRLGRIYDPEGTGHDSCNLARCLSTLRDNPQFFTQSAVTARLTEGYREANPDYHSFHRLDLKRIETDLKKIKSCKRLINLRHKVYAHKDLETVLSGKRDEFLSSHDEVKELIQGAHDIWNHYSQIWNASTYSAMTIGEDDYKWLFTNLRRGMKVKSVLDNRRTNRIIQRINSYKKGGC